jgi:hypothetical protein
LTIPRPGAGQALRFDFPKNLSNRDDSQAIRRRYHSRVRCLGNSRRDSTISTKGTARETTIELGLVEESSIFPLIVQG